MKMTSEKGTLGCDRLFDPAAKIPDFDTDDSMHKALCFREDLIVHLKNECSSDTKPVGGYCISVERIGAEGNEFTIQVLSSLTVNDSFAGSKVLASSTARFHCLEEKRTEYINRCDGLYEKTLYLGLEEEVYHVRVEDSCPCNKSVSKIDLPLCSSGELISEGVDVLLMRYLALKNFHGSLSFFGLTIEGRLTTSNYRCSEARRMKFNCREVEVYTVERKIHEECGLVHDSKTLLTKNGRILRHDWLELPYLLKINSLVDPNKVDNQERRIYPPLRSRWSSDIQLMSMYLDKKTCQMAQQTEYLADHPEIKQLISDFTQSLLAGESNLGPILSQLAKQRVKRVCGVCGICFESAQPSPDEECDCAIRSSVTPVASPCSVFAECPSEAPCNLHLCRKTNSPVSLSCSVFTKCPSDASCVKRTSGDTAVLSSCSIFSRCPDDASCVRKFPPCSDAVLNCLKYCEGCKSYKNRRSVCSLRPECEKTCQGCMSDENRRSVCSLGPECEKTCQGCKSDENRRSVCSLHPECEKTCKGCRYLRAEACLVTKDCPECPGCREVCNETEVCPDCRGCDSVELSAKEERMH